METALKIRAHHLLCLKGFQGYGYSERFTENMKLIKNLLSQEPEILLEIVTETDTICVYCPFTTEKGCMMHPEALEIIPQMDAQVLSKLNLKPGTQIPNHKAFSLVEDKFKTIADLAGICLECRWHEKCLWYQSRVKV